MYMTIRQRANREYAGITYRVENNAVSDTTDIAAVATIDQSTGELKILKGGYHIKVIATIAGDTNYESTEIAKALLLKIVRMICFLLRTQS